MGNGSVAAFNRIQGDFDLGISLEQSADESIIADNYIDIDEFDTAVRRGGLPNGVHQLPHNRQHHQAAADLTGYYLDDGTNTVTGCRVSGNTVLMTDLTQTISSTGSTSRGDETSVIANTIVGVAAGDQPRYRAEYRGRFQ